MARWQMPKTNNQRKEANLSGGINTGADSFALKDNQSVSEYGWDTDEHYPALVTAKAPTAYGTSGSGVTRLLTKFGNTHMVRAVGTALQYNSTGTTWAVITGTFADADWDAANFDVGGAALILTNGTDNVKYWDGSALADLNSSDAPKGKYVTADNLRVFIANAAGDQTPDIIHFCKFQDATDWTAALDSGAVQFYTPNGGAITAIRSFGGQIWVFKQDSFALIYHTGDSRAAYRLVPSSDNIGCVNFKTVVEVGDILYWLGAEDIYLGASGAANAIGEPVRDYINRINQTHVDKCCGFTDGIRYYLNLVIDDATEPNVRLMYDPRHRIWRVSGIDEAYRYGVQFNGKVYAGNATGQTVQVNAAASSGTAVIETKDFDRSEAEKEYYELHVQQYAPSGTTVTFAASVDQGATWYTIGDPVVSSSAAQNQNIIIPLTDMPLGNWVRFKITAVGEYRLHAFQRHFNILPIMH